MEFKQLERFVATADQGNIGSAAVRLGVSQPALTRTIQLLEEAVGSPLFDRLPRGVKLTALGAKLLPYARLIVRERTLMQEAVDEFNGLSGGVITFGVSSNLLETVGAEAVVRFRNTYEAVRVAVHTGLLGEMIAMLQDGSLDLALCTIGSKTIPDGVAFEPLFHKMTSIVVRGQHPLAMKPSVSFGELARESWIIMGGDSEVEGLERTFERHGAVAPPFAIKCESLPFIKACLLKDDYVAILDQGYVAAEIKNGAIRVLITENEGVSLVSGLLYRKEGARPPIMTSFIQSLRQLAKSR